jgi:alkylhydroperoxidase/carboxymuconolactone decarboxylase family protein YurZ
VLSCAPEKPGIREEDLMSKLPSFYSSFRDAHPEVAKAYETLGEATRAAGPLAARQAELVKLALAAGARIEGAVHSHARRALEAGASREELRHVALLAITTLGFPAAMAVRAQIEDVVSPGS